jgi:hypothetical protein
MRERESWNRVTIIPNIGDAAYNVHETMLFTYVRHYKYFYTTKILDIIG